MARKRIETAAKPNDDLSVFVDRVERLEEERRNLAADIKTVLQEASDAGHAKVALRAVVKRRLETPEQESKRKTNEDQLEDMLSRLGMLVGTPLGLAATSNVSDLRSL